MGQRAEIYLASVCLERNRWGSRQPSFRVSDWLPRLAADGFDGVELWENHFLAADEAEQRRLAESGAVAVYNTYAGFGDADAAPRARAAGAVARLRPRAVKYNVGPDRARLEEYRRQLRAWAAALPRDCRLLCECHAGTALERPAEAAAFLAPFDPERFGAIVHAGGAAEEIEPWFEALGARVRLLHVQLRGAERDPAVPANRPRLDAGFAAVRARGFRGAATIEFTRGIGKQEDIETLYANACVDLAYCREQLAGPEARPTLGS